MLDINTLEKEDLINYIKDKKDKQYSYYKKYINTENGKENMRKSQKSYYDRNREKILERKKLYYQMKKENQQNKQID